MGVINVNWKTIKRKKHKTALNSPKLSEDGIANATENGEHCSTGQAGRTLDHASASAEPRIVSHSQRIEQVP